MSTRTETTTINVGPCLTCGCPRGTCCSEIGGLPASLLVQPRFAGDLLTVNDAFGTHSYAAQTLRYIGTVMSGTGGTSTWRTDPFDLSDGECDDSPGGIDLICEFTDNGDGTFSSGLGWAIWCGTPDNQVAGGGPDSEGTCDPFHYHGATANNISGCIGGCPGPGTSGDGFFIDVVAP